MRGGSHRALLLYGAIGALFDIVLEFFWIRGGLYDYFGPQPFEVLGFPLYWAFLNTAYLFVVGYAFYLAQNRLTGRRLLLGIPITVVGFGVLYGLAWPTWIAMNIVGGPAWLMWVTATGTMAGSAYLVWLVALAVHRYGSPLRLVRRDADSATELAVSDA
jgi:hypothetical protein